MAHDNTARKDTSMDDILSSIRRIIDESEARKQGHSDGPSAPANDVAPVPSRHLSGGFAAHPLAERDDPSSLQSVLAKLDAEMNGHDAPEADEPQPDAEDELTQAIFADQHAEKYEARFSEEDSRAFATLGDVLAGQAAAAPSKPVADVVAAQDKPDSSSARADQSVAVFQPTADHLQKLVSEPVAQAVAHSFGNLEEVLSRHNGQSLTEVTQTMLKPMLQEWLDENLPSMVERMVRGEIERIARGEPRQG
ncbi:MAG: DUF2497 domain-containing protein [Ahrensia sp.]